MTMISSPYQVSDSISQDISKNSRRTRVLHEKKSVHDALQFREMLIEAYRQFP